MAPALTKRSLKTDILCQCPFVVLRVIDTSRNMLQRMSETEVQVWNVRHCFDAFVLTAKRVRLLASFFSVSELAEGVKFLASVDTCALLVSLEV